MRNGQFLLFAGILTAAVNPAFGTQLDGEPLSCDDFIISLETKADIDFYSTCPQLVGFVSISHEFTGPLEMPNVKSIGRFNAGYLGPKLKFSTRVEDEVTSISMPALEEATDWVLMAYLNNLTSISFPKLRTIGKDMVVLDNPELKTVSFLALENVTAGILIDGDINEINLPNLKHVAFLKIKSTGDIDCRALGKNLSSLVFHPREFDVGKGFTCYTYDEQNRYNSSDPTGSGPANPTSSEPSEGVSVRVGYLAALFSLVAMAIF
ncbi:hypothetical protein GX50_08452 [[Emmonsia] crescens]|uniref:Uncharacterized protein n=1 Tax=[Emmonsia] crescens TaxID=73230 RepID=A0A2B7Z6M8_9EURO|nr:hypothetical protein GX50_08452 [Emmonsia crescens]